MRIVVVHNRYRSAQPSGENLVVDQETALLRAAGHEVVAYERASDDIAGFSLLQRSLVPGRAVWSPVDRAHLAERLEDVHPDVVHLHNTFPLISPSVLEACRAHGFPVVATLHNFRLMCANAQLLRDGRPCDLCVGRGPWPGVVHRCYRGSAAATVPVAVGIQLHRRRQSWTRGVTTFIALTEFVRRQYLAGGFPGDRIQVKPNFVPRPARRRTGAGSHLLFLGRLSPDKGVDVLLNAWAPRLGRLLIVGDGPARRDLEVRAAAHGDSVRFLGRQPHDRCMELLAGARALVVASRAYETFGLVVVEAYAHGVPAVAPAMGAFPDLVRDGRTGQLFSPGDPEDLRRALVQALDPERSLRLGAEAWHRYEAEFTPEQNLATLEAIYQAAIEQGGRVTEPQRRPQVPES
jgi:glycosyltransferase involved in cell wall biosynthesis